MDVDPMSRAIRRGHKELEHFREESIEQFRDFGKEIFKSLGAVGTFAVLETAMRKVEQISRSAESLGVSTDFVQNIRNVGTASQFSAEAMEKAMDKFAKSLPVGSDVEEQFYKLADRIAKTEDPITRVHMAIDAFGQKMGVQMIPLLARGSDGIKELAKSFDILTESELKNIEEAHVSLEKTQNQLIVWAGKGLAAVQQTVEAFATSFLTGESMGSIGKQMGAEESEKVNAGKKEKADLKAAQAEAKKEAKRRRLEEAQDEAEKQRSESIIRHGTNEQKVEELGKLRDQAYANQFLVMDEVEMLKWKEKELEYEDQILAVKKKMQDEDDRRIEKAKRLAEQVENALDATKATKREIEEAKRAPYEFTLQDLAAEPMQFFSNRGWVGAFGENMARGILQDRAAAKQAYIHGNFGRGDFLRDRAEGNLSALEKQQPWLQNPQRKMNETLEKQEKHLEQIRDRAVGTGGHGLAVESVQE